MNSGWVDSFRVQARHGSHLAGQLEATGGSFIGEMYKSRLAERHNLNERVSEVTSERRVTSLVFHHVNLVTGSEQIQDRPREVLAVPAVYPGRARDRECFAHVQDGLFTGSFGGAIN